MNTKSNANTKKPQPVPGAFRSLVLRIAQHEAGHYIVARVLGFRVGAISLKIIDMNASHSGGAIIMLAEDLTAADAVAKFLRRRVQALYAGVLAESLKDGKVDVENALSYIRTGGATDHAKVRELIALIRNIECGEVRSEDAVQAQLNALDTELWNAAAVIVEQEHVLIEGLGSRLASEVKHIGKLYEISESELNSLPALVSRFGPAVDGQLS